MGVTCGWQRRKHLHRWLSALNLPVNSREGGSTYKRDDSKSYVICSSLRQTKETDNWQVLNTDLTICGIKVYPFWNPRGKRQNGLVRLIYYDEPFASYILTFQIDVLNFPTNLHFYYEPIYVSLMYMDLLVTKLWHLTSQKINLSLYNCVTIAMPKSHTKCVTDEKRTYILILLVPVLI